MVTVDLTDLQGEIHNLSAFIQSESIVSINIKEKTLVIDSGKQIVSARNVKAFVKRFLHDKGLSESYRAIEENGVVRIKKRKGWNKRKSERAGTKPSPYRTLPYFFPNRP